MGVKQILCCMIFSIIFHCSASAPKSTGFRLKLVPWDSPNSPLYPGNLTLLEKHQRIVESSRKLMNAKLDSISVPIKNQQNFRYSVNVKFGSPGKMVALLVDTGSSFVCTQCNMPTSYQPSHSQSHKKLPCKHPLCAKSMCKCIEEQCVCKIPYGSTHIQKKLKVSMDTLHIPRSGRGPEKSFSNFVFGCTNESAVNLSGLFALDGTPTSIVRQLKEETQGMFSYCLRNGDSSYLTLGKDFNHDIGGPHVKYTHLIHTDQSPFLLNLTDISVAGKRMGLSSSIFSFKKRGVSMDTGIQYTVLPRKEYEKVSKAFASYNKGVMKKLNETYWNLDNCYKVTPGFKDFPTMTFHFHGADLVTRYTYVHYKDIACLAVVRGRRIIIGAVQQWNTRFMFDVNKNVLKFHKDDDCASPAY